MYYMKMKEYLIQAVLLLLISPVFALGQATINWTAVHQVIDGFGAATEDKGASMSTANQNFFFGTGTGQLGLSLLRVGVTDGNQDPGDCTTVSVSCAGAYVSDMKAIIATGGRVYASPWSPPAAYKSNGSTSCTSGSGNGALISGDYASYATYLANYIKSLSTEDGISLYAISIQNEPDVCPSYDGTLWTAANIDTFIKTNLGPTFASAGLSTLIFMPETGAFTQLTGAHGGATCATDSSCYNYIGGINWHDYSTTANSADTIGAAANPWSSLGKKYWQTEASCGTDFGPSGCEHTFTTDMATDGLMWAGLLDDRMAVENANAYLFWLLINFNGVNDNEALMNYAGTVASRAYVFGQYSKFIRPGYYRIDATHKPQTGVTVSAYQNTSSNTLVIVATNYTASPVSQEFTLTNAPTFTSITPTITSPSLNLAAQTSVTVTSQAFTYSLPAQSVTTFVGIGTAGGNGSCPSGANYLSEPTDALVTLAALGVTNCYYVSKQSGASDSNPGTSESAPWLHAPGMTGCTVNCLTLYNAGITVGTGLIFRGGDTWSYGNGTTTSTGLPWTCGYPKQCSGTATNPVYAGFDKTWYTGSSWVQPTLDMGNPLSTSTVSSCTYDDGAMTGALNHEPLFLYNTNYIIFDNFQFKGYCWDKTAGTYAYLVGNNIQFVRNYFHGWTYVPETGATCTGGYCDVNHMITGSGSAGIYAFNTFDGTDSSPLSGFAMYPQNAYDVHGSVFRKLSNGAVLAGPGIHTFHDNLAEGLTLSYDGTTHANVWEFLTAYPGNNSYFNNAISNVLNDGGIKLWIHTGTQTSIDYVYNNSVSGVVDSNCFNIAQAVANTTTNTVNFINNTFDQCTIDTASNSVTNPFKGILAFENNHFIRYATQNLAGVWENGTGTYAGAATSSDLGGNIYQTEATANGQGYVPATNYEPTSGSGATIGAGLNLTSLCSIIGIALCSDTTLGGTQASVPRPTTGNWDSGAFIYQGGGSSIASPTNVKSTAH